MALATTSHPYRYEPLTGLRDIRLLRIAMVDDLPDVSIVHVGLEASPPFVAISYVWGDATFEASLNVGGHNMQLTRSLAIALKDVVRGITFSIQAQSAISAHLDPSVFYLWADAICIDQNDVAEKNLQVPLMGDIYSRASFVATHLGEYDKAFEEGWELMLLLQQWHGKRVRDRIDRVLEEEYDLEDLGLPHADSSAWTALRNIMHAKWSKRAWIVQEFVVNPNLILFCGHISIHEWRIFQQMQVLVTMRELPVECFSASGSDRASSLQHAVKQESTIYSLTSLREWYRKEDQSLNKSLVQLLSTGQVLEATDLRDKVYAFLGLASDQTELRIRPDYSSSNTVVAVYTLTASEIIRVSGKLDVFSSVNITKQLPGLASWVPDWSGRTSVMGSHLLHYTELIRANLYIAAGETKVTPVVDLTTQKMTLKGAIIDRIAFTIANNSNSGDPFDEPPLNIPAAWRIIQAYYDTTEGLEVKSQTTYSTKSHQREAFWRTLLANVTHDGKEATDDYAANFDAYLLLHEMLESGKIASARDAEQTIQRMARTFSNATASRLSGRCLAMSRSGYLCLVQDGVAPGDVVAVLRGGRTPFVLRAISAVNATGRPIASDVDHETKYRLLSDAYVHGLMKGEALQWTNLDASICLV